MPGYDPNDPANQETYALSADEPAFLDPHEERYIRNRQHAHNEAVAAWADAMLEGIRTERGYKEQHAGVRRLRASMDQSNLAFVDLAVAAIAYNEGIPVAEVREALRVIARANAEKDFDRRVVAGYETLQKGAR